MNARLPGDKCVYLDVMLGKSHSSMLQNDLVFIKSKSKCGQKIRERRGNVENQLKGPEVLFSENSKARGTLTRTWSRR